MNSRITNDRFTIKRIIGTIRIVGLQMVGLQLRIVGSFLRNNRYKQRSNWLVPNI
jgi:hypothetical protein